MQQNCLSDKKDSRTQLTARKHLKSIIKLGSLYKIHLPDVLSLKLFHDATQMYSLYKSEINREKIHE
jgi:hypothetical protein